MKGLLHGCVLGFHTRLDADGLTVSAVAAAADRGDVNAECIPTGHVTDGTGGVCGVA